MKHNWTDERIEQMKRLWVEESASCSQIARILGGVSRSAVIGKLHRLGLAKQQSENKFDPRKGRAPKPRRVSTRRTPDRLVNLTPQMRELAQSDNHPEPARLPNGLLISTADLTRNHCRFPHGHVGDADFHYCGLPPDKGPYCTFHAARVFVPAAPKPEKRASRM